MNGITPQGTKALTNLGVNKIIDLRFKQGKNGYSNLKKDDPGELTPSHKLTGTNIPIENDKVYSSRDARSLKKQVKSQPNGEKQYYGDLSVTNPNAIQAYKAVFNDLLNNKSGAVLYHCNLGRDRTGITSALILSALGVSPQTIYNDYLMTGAYNGYSLKKQNTQVGHLNKFFNTIDSNYGSVNGYLHKGLGLNNNAIHQLQKMYLQPVK